MFTGSTHGGHVERRSLVPDLRVVEQHEVRRRACTIVHTVAGHGARVRVAVQVQIRNVRTVGVEGLCDGQEGIVRWVRCPVPGGIVRGGRVEEVVRDAALACMDICAGIPDACELQRVVQSPHRRAERVGDAGDTAAGRGVELPHRDRDVRSMCSLDASDLPLRKADH